MTARRSDALPTTPPTLEVPAMKNDTNTPETAAPKTETPKPKMHLIAASDGRRARGRGLPPRASLPRLPAGDSTG